MRKFLISLVLLVIVLVIIDRAAVLLASRELGTKIQNAYSLPVRPGVDIHGFPFLTQVASGNYQEVDVTISTATADGVQLHDVRAKFTGVHAPLALLFGQNSRGVTADHATGTALIPFSQVELKLPKGIRLSADGGDTLRVSGAITLGAITGTARLGVTRSGSISVTPVRLSVAGISSGSLIPRFTFVIPVVLPLHLAVSGVHVSSAGLVVSATGSDVQFAGS
ncbi:MAG TPA: DUF2993 domain-containing protein [Streptosporangiaceae bacterium]|nr:DUF2993 domain-containing protein [Streptosporangiaceae bacterium]